MAHVSGSTSGNRMPIAPQLLPVEKAVKAASTNTVAGSTSAGKLSPKLAMRKAAVWSSWLISDIDQASTKIIMARNVNRAPDTQASTISSSVSNRCAAVIKTAVKAERREAHIKARYELADPTISPTESPSPVMYNPAKIPMTMTATGISALMARGGIPGFMANAASSS